MSECIFGCEGCQARQKRIEKLERALIEVQERALDFPHGVPAGTVLDGIVGVVRMALRSKNGEVKE